MIVRVNLGHGGPPLVLYRLIMQGVTSHGMKMMCSQCERILPDVSEMQSILEETGDERGLADRSVRAHLILHAQAVTDGQ